MLNAVSARRFIGFLLSLGVAASLGMAWLVRDAPLAPGALGGMLRADSLGALFALVTAGLALAELVSGREEAPSRLLAAPGLLAAAYLSGHLGVMAALFGLAGLARVNGRRPADALPAAAPLICLALGAASLGLRAGEWRYGEPGAGAGLNSGAFALLLLAALLGGGMLALVDGRDEGPARRIDPLLGPAMLYPLLRLDSLGPWNLGWLAAALLLGCAAALWAAWRAATDTPARAAAWLPRYLIGLAIVGAGLGSGAGLALAAFALLGLPLMALGLGAAAEPTRPWPLWALSAAAPFGLPFVVSWVGVAAATAGRVPALAAALWVAALLSAVPVARLASEGGAGRWWPQDARLLLAAGLSAGLGLGAPLALALLVRPVVSQLAGGLSPMGEIALWPWAGLIALDAARQPVASLPTLAMAGLMIILAALAWIGTRLISWRGRRGEG
ncbi:hypothetical protein K2Z83_20445 [Oscillochloris sp. ZM17-4]|uniref:hypothetical protein n=1 Tax=Oscillochloris sp. ZM17-4 TaxID=2866714 RepID=UPI001C73B25C|nr:hypothetical protein [Oscillochloris sp. ZM17-4]MBX0330042.1 hypothetical protein [Oscillochloris sp. ZM17-4]